MGEDKALFSANIKVPVELEFGTSVVFTVVGVMLGIVAIVIFVKIYSK